MSKQFTFFLTPKDSFELRLRLSEGTDAVFLADESPKPKPTVFPDLFSKTIEGETMVYIARPSDLEKIRFEKIPRRKIWAVDSLTSPVVEFANCYYDGKTVGPGRMYTTTGFYEEDGAWTNKDPAFLEWVNQTFRMAKRYLERDKMLDAYLGEETSCLLNQGKIQLSSFIG